MNKNRRLTSKTALVDRNGKGIHSFKIKKYYDSDTTNAEDVIESMKAIEDKLKESFPDE